MANSDQPSENVSGRMRTFAESASRAAAIVEKRVQRGASAVTEAARQTAGQIGKASHYVQEQGGKLRQKAADAGEYATGHPGYTAVAAGLAGFGIGLAFRFRAGRGSRIAAGQLSGSRVHERSGMRNLFRREEQRRNIPMSSVSDIRKRARTNLDDGAVTESYQGDRQTVLRLLNDTLATEVVCALRYRRHYFMASGIHAYAAAAEFLEHANTEQLHADRVSERIVQLGGEPDLNPDTLTRRSHAEYVEGANLRDMLRENLVAERIAIESYSEFIRYLGDSDPTTRRLMEEILANEEEHADDLKTLMERFGTEG